MSYIRYIGSHYETCHVIFNMNSNEYEVWSFSDFTKNQAPWNGSDLERKNLQGISGWQYSLRCENDKAAMDKVYSQLLGGYFSY